MSWEKCPDTAKYYTTAAYSETYELNGKHLHNQLIARRSCIFFFVHLELNIDRHSMKSKKIDEFSKLTTQDSLTKHVYI